jgi:hypothetical protein
MIIYRVETESGRGPYVDLDGLGYNCGSVHHAPNPWEDCDLKPEWCNLMRNGEGEAFYFGFSTPQLLLDWFHSGDFHREAENAGYRVSVVEVLGRVFHGTYQSIFERSKSAVTKRLTFNEIKQLAI